MTTCLDCGHDLLEHPAGHACHHHHASVVPILECEQCRHPWQAHLNHGEGGCVRCPCPVGRFTVAGFGVGRLQVCSCPRFLGPRPR